MSLIRLSGVAFGYPDAPPLFSDVTFDLPSGWSAIAGPNGAGKTTLMRLIAGELSPSAGRVERGELAIASVRQAPREPPEEVRAFAWEWDARACRLRARFALEVEQLERWPALCGGERQRWQIAAALARRPDVLLLDEPTNHLDVEARAALAEALREHRGIGVVVAHDRAFLDALAERVIWVEGGEATAMPGTYTEVQARRRAGRRRRQRRRAEAKAELSRLAGELDARRRRERSASGAVGARARIKGPRDSDGRSVGRKIRAANAAAKHSRAADRMSARVEDARSTLEAARVERERHGEIALDGELAPKSSLLRLDLPALRAGDALILEPFCLALSRDDRVRLAGPNGCGKSTLIQAIVERWPHDPERLLYLPQREPDGAALLERVERADPDTRGRALSLCAALGLSVPRLRASARPSPGEARKLALAEGLARRVWCVVLDEPTNHLDVPSIERLEAALVAYPGALLVATHDDALAAAVTSARWALRERRVSRM